MIQALAELKPHLSIQTSRAQAPPALHICSLELVPLGENYIYLQMIKALAELKPHLSIQTSRAQAPPALHICSLELVPMGGKLDLPTNDPSIS